MKEQIKEFRIKLDGLAQLTKELAVGKKLVIDMATLPNKGDHFNPEEWEYYFNTLGVQFNEFKYREYNEVAKAVDSLYLAKAWLGKVLQELQPKGKTVLIVERVKQGEDYIKEHNLKKEDYIIAFEEEKCRGQYISDYKYISITDKFYIQLKQITKENEIDLAIHKYFTKICNWVRTPYINDGKRKTVEDIEPAADVNKEVKIGNAYWETLSGWGDKNHIEKVDWLRTEIENVLIEIRFIGDLGLSGTTYSNTFISNVTTHLSEARFWLGFELERIKNN